MHRGRGKPRSPARQAGPTEIRDYTRNTCKTRQLNPSLTFRVVMAANAQLRNVPAGCLSPFLNDSTPGFVKFNPEPTGQEQREPRLKMHTHSASTPRIDFLSLDGDFPGIG